MVMLAMAGVKAADVGFFVAAKGQRLMQTNAGAAVPVSASNFVFIASVEPGSSGGLTNGWFTPPGGTPISFLGGPPGTEGEFEQVFTNATALDAAFPNGAYSFVTQGVNDGTRTNSVVITGGVYPATPFFNAFNAAQAINPAADFNLTWNVIAGATGNDHISLEIMDCQDEHIVSTPPPGKPGSLNGLATNYIIRARSLRPGQQYKLKFLVAQFSTVETNSYPGATGVAGYFKEVFMPLTTTGTPVGCPPGQLSMTFDFPQGQLDGTNGVLQFPTALQHYALHYNVRGDVNAPEFITFSGPGGSGLNNTTNAYRQAGEDGAWFSSPQVNVPPFPPGGLYNINYGGNVRGFNLLDPDAGNQQVVLLPRLVLDEATNIVEVRWSFADTNGNTISRPSFVVNISLSLQSQAGPLYSSDWFEQPIPGDAPGHILFEPLPLELVQGLQLSFRDPAGNTFFSSFGGGGGPPGLEIITQTLPPGNVGNSYGYSLVAQGGQPPYLWRLSAGTLPSGLFLNPDTGEISGTPSEQTVREFVVEVSDSRDQSTQRSFVLSIGQGGSHEGPDRFFYAALKGRRWMQTNSGPVVPSPEGSHFFNVFVESSGASSVTEAGIVPPGGTLLMLESEHEGEAKYEQEFSSQGALDAAFPGGDYAVVTAAAQGGNRTNMLLLAGDSYLAAPLVSNYAASQAIDPVADFVLSWNQIAGGSEMDFLQVELRDCNGEDVFSTPPPGEPGALNGTSSNFTFRARSLRPGSAYKAQIFVARFTDMQTNSPGATGLAGYVSVTELELRTQGTNPGCPEGRLSFVFNFPPGAIEGTNGTITFPTALEHYAAHYEFRGESNPPPGVTFTGPVGSGLNNTTNGEAGFYYGGGYYSSMPVAVPPFPPGGNYVVAFNGNNRTFPMLASVAAGQQVVLVPTMHVDVSGMLTAIEWRPASTNGTTAASPTFIENVSLVLQGSNGPVYQAGFDGMPLPGGATSHTLVYPVPWDQVGSVQLLFHDAAGDTYISTFNRGGIEPPPSLQIVTSSLPPGDVGTNYSFTITAEGGELPYFWEKLTGSLPAGLTLNEATGELSGVPNAGGSYSFTIRVNDVMEDHHDRSFTLNIRGGGNTNPVIAGFGIIKGQAFMQAGAGAPIVGTNEPFRFEAFVDTTVEGIVTNAVVRSPKGTNYVLVPDSLSFSNPLLAAGGDEFGSESFHFTQFFATKGAFDNSFGSGSYAFQIGATGYSNKTVNMNLPGDAYPATPHVANWAAAQMVDSFNDFTLTWDLLSGATTNDVIQIEIENEDGSVYHSPEPGEPGALHGRSTAHVIPGGTLAPGGLYKGMLLIGRMVTINTNGFPGAKGFGAYAKATFFPINTVTPPPPQGQIQFSAATYSGSETGMVAQFTITRTGGTEGEVSVDFTTSDGTALGDLDYEVTSGPLVMADGESEATFSVTIFDDEVFDTNETLHLTISNPTGGATLGAQTNATVTILDNDEPGTAGLLQFSATSVVVGESSATVTLTVTRTDGKAGEVSVDYSTGDGSAEGELDYAPTSGTLIFPANVTSQTFTIGIVNDNLDETNETFEVHLDNPGGGASLGTRNVATVGITDNDAGGEIKLSAAAYRFSETNEEAVITLTRSGGVAGEVSVDVVISDVTATGDEDYIATAETVSFEAGETTATFVLLIDNDSLPEGDETMTIDLANPTGGATLGRGTNAVVTIVDDEESLQFSAEAYTVNESASAVVLTVLRSGPATGTVTVDYLTTSGSAESDEDFLGTNGTLTLGPGVKSRTFSIRLNRDEAVEEDEDFSVELGNPVGALLGTVTEAVVNIIDDDEGGVINFKTAGFTVKENAPFAVVTVTRTGGDASGVSFTLATSDGSAEDGDDYTGVEETFEFEAGANSMKIEIPILNDGLDETNETIQLTLSEPTGGATLGELSEATLTIVDNDTGGVIAFSAATYSITETGTVAIVTLTRSGGAAEGVSVDFVAAGGTATPGNDYSALTSTIYFESNQTRLNIEIEIADDELPDGNKTVLLALSSPTGGARLGTRTNAVLNITDDEKSLQFTNVTFTVIEGVRNAVIGVKRSGPTKGAITVQYATSDGTATAGSDYTSRTGTLSFSSGSTLKTITIPILNDTAAEGDETFTVTLSNPSDGVLLGENDTITVTIQDNDPGAPLTRRARR